MQGEAIKDGGIAGKVHEELGGELGSWEATAAKEKIGLSLNGGLKHTLFTGYSSDSLSLSSISPPIAIGSGKSASSLMMPMWIMRRRRRRRKRKQTKPIFAIFPKVQA